MSLTYNLPLMREWFERHRHDYCNYCLHGPPKVWAEYMDHLLTLCGAQPPIDEQPLPAPPAETPCQIPVCVRCGYLKSRHHLVNYCGRAAVICPTATFAESFQAPPAETP